MLTQAEAPHPYRSQGLPDQDPRHLATAGQEGRPQRPVQGGLQQVH